MTPDSIPAEGQRVLIRRNANLSTGGMAIDVTAKVHRDVAARAVEQQDRGTGYCGNRCGDN